MQQEMIFSLAKCLSIRLQTGFESRCCHLKKLNNKVTSNKTKHVIVKKKSNKLLEKNYMLEKIIVLHYIDFFLQGMMDFKICLFIKQHLAYQKHV